MKDNPLKMFTVQKIGNKKPCGKKVSEKVSNNIGLIATILFFLFLIFSFYSMIGRVWSVRPFSYYRPALLPRASSAEALLVRFLVQVDCVGRCDQSAELVARKVRTSFR